MFIFKEYERILKKKDQLTKGEINKEDISKILFGDDFNKSNDELKENYECFSEEIDNIFKMIKQKKVNAFAKICGPGWGGPVAIIGTTDVVSLLNTRFHSVNNFVIINEVF